MGRLILISEVPLYPTITYGLGRGYSTVSLFYFHHGHSGLARSMSTGVNEGQISNGERQDAREDIYPALFMVWGEGIRGPVRFGSLDSHRRQQEALGQLGQDEPAWG